MKAVVYGGGNIGRGFLGQLLFNSGFEMVFVDVNRELIDKINEKGSYPIKIVSNEKQEEVIISNVRAVHADNAVDEIATADIIFTSAGVRILPFVAPVLRAGIEKRTKGVDIVICENLMDADKYLKELVNLDREDVGYVEASVGRMVPVMTDEMREGDITKVWVEPFCTLPVDKAAFKNPIPDIKGMVPSEPFQYYIQSKLFLHNMGHAIAAYLGMNKGYTYIWEAMGDKEIYATVREAMLSSAKALAAEHGKDEKEVVAYAEDLMFRFQNKYLGDTTERVGRDPERKLEPNDRLLGAIKLCHKHNLPVEGIKKGVMAALDRL